MSEAEDIREAQTLNSHSSRSRNALLAAVITIGLPLLGGCSAPLFGTDKSQEGRTDTQEPPAKTDAPARDRTESTSGVEDMEIEPEDILQGGADPEQDATRAPSNGDDTLKNPKEEDQESEDKKRRR